jgi:N-terminal half of MaoC dehydratase
LIKKEMAGTKLLDFEFPVERGKIREFASAICDPNPIYKDLDYARQHGFSDVLMPVTFPASFFFHLDSENAVLDMTLKLGMNPATSVHGETEFIFNRAVCAGETLRCELSIGNIYEKQGKRGGTMTFVEMECNFFDDSNHNTPVAVFRNVFIEKS